MISCGSPRRGVDRTLVKVSRRLKEAFHCKAQSLRPIVLDADNRLGVTVGRAAGTVESARPETFLPHTASRCVQAGTFRKGTSSDHGSRKEAPPEAMLNSPGAHDPPKYLGYGV